MACCCSLRLDLCPRRRSTRRRRCGWPGPQLIRRSPFHGDKRASVCTVSEQTLPSRDDGWFRIATIRKRSPGTDDLTSSATQLSFLRRIASSSHLVERQAGGKCCGHRAIGERPFPAGRRWHKDVGGTHLAYLRCARTHPRREREGREVHESTSIQFSWNEEWRNVCPRGFPDTRNAGSPDLICARPETSSPWARPRKT